MNNEEVKNEFVDALNALLATLWKYQILDVTVRFLGL